MLRFALRQKFFVCLRLVSGGYLDLRNQATGLVYRMRTLARTDYSCFVKSLGNSEWTASKFKPDLLASMQNYGVDGAAAGSAPSK